MLEEDLDMIGETVVAAGAAVTGGCAERPLLIYQCLHIVTLYCTYIIFLYI
jgi:hypothetical protein